MLYKHCRICLTKTFKYSCFSNGENSIKYKMRCCVPEIDLNVISDPVLCDACVQKLDVAYNFKLQCMSIEDKILDYIKTMQPETLHIQLLDVIRMIIANPTKDQPIEKVYLSQDSEIVHFAPVVDPIEIAQDAMEIDDTCGENNKGNDVVRVEDNKAGEIKYTSAFQKRISSYIEQHNIVSNNDGESSKKQLADSDVEVIVVEDAPSNKPKIVNEILARGRGRPRTGLVIQQSPIITNNTAKENVQQNTSTNQNKSDSKGHVMKDGAIIKKPFGCTKCSETFETIDRLLKHVREHKSSSNYSRNYRVTTTKDS